MTCEEHGFMRDLLERHFPIWSAYHITSLIAKEETLGEEVKFQNSAPTHPHCVRQKGSLQEFEESWSFLVSSADVLRVRETESVR